MCVNKSVKLSMNDLKYYTDQLNKAIESAADLLDQKKHGKNIPDFDIRGQLYKLALELAPNATDSFAVTEVLVPMAIPW